VLRAQKISTAGARPTLGPHPRFNAAFAAEAAAAAAAAARAAAPAAAKRVRSDGGACPSAAQPDAKRLKLEPGADDPPERKDAKKVRPGGFEQTRMQWQSSQSHAYGREHDLETNTRETDWIYLVLSGMQNRTFGPYLTANNSILISPMSVAFGCTSARKVPV
jgi:hypothetical protein